MSLKVSSKTRNNTEKTENGVKSGEMERFYLLHPGITLAVFLL